MPLARRSLVVGGVEAVNKKQRALELLWVTPKEVGS
jgi:hypothetical protein